MSDEAVGADGIGDDVATGIRRARESRGMSTRELAHLAGVSQPLLSNIENGRALPSVHTLYALAEGLGIGPGALLPSRREAAPEHSHLAPLTEPGTDDVDMQLLFASPDSRVEAYLVRQRAGFRDPEQYVHGGEDVIHVLEGRVTLVCGETEHDLAAGDTVWLDGGMPHAFTTPRSSGVVALIVTCREEPAGDATRPAVAER